MSFGNPIVAGNTLIREAIQSPNFVTTLSGWRIGRDGSAEFNNIIVRGEFQAGVLPGSVITINDGGLEFVAVDQKANIDDNQGFIVQHTLDPPFTNYAQLDVVPNGGQIVLGTPESTNVTHLIQPAQIYVQRLMVGTVAVPSMSLQAPYVDLPVTRGYAGIDLVSESSNGLEESHIDLIATEVRITDKIIMSGFIQRLAMDTVTADSGTFTAETVVQSVTADLVSGMTYRIGVMSHGASTVVGDGYIGRIREDNLTGTELQSTFVTVDSNVIGGTINMEAYFVATATGSKTFVLTGVRSGGTGNCRLEAASNRPSYVYLEWIQ